jgi:UDP-N-acetyl-D-glucosamine dehydrogenase
MSLDALLEKIRTRQAVIGVFGLGYVGLPLVIRFAEAGFEVIGFDIDEEKIAAINEGRSYLNTVSNESIAAATQRGLAATSDYARAKLLDALIICVPTPLNRYREPDLSFVTSTVENVLPHTKAGQILSLESTTYPGTTEELIKPLLEFQGFEIGQNYHLVYSPEREDPGNKDFTTQQIPKVCGGSTENCLTAGVALYSEVVDRVIPVSNTKTAEMTKLLENIYRAVNIGLVNEMKIVADKMGINIHEVIEAAATKPFGFTKFTPGPGLGGHCIPIDPFYLTWKAREYGVNTRFIELAGEVNRAMPAWVVQKTADALNEQGKAVKGSRILVLGLAYKKNVNDTRESPAVEIIHLLKQRGALVHYSDPHIREFPSKRDFSFDMTSVDLTQSALENYDCAVLATDHDAFDYKLLNASKISLIDTRNKLTGLQKRVIA